MRTIPGFRKGCNLGGWLSQCYLSPEHIADFITEKDFEKIRNMGMDHVRLPVDYPLFETKEGEDIEQGYACIDRCMQWCEKYGLHVLLDLHKVPGYEFSKAEECHSFFTDLALRKRFIRIWDKLSRRYGKYDFVAFDLLNEIVDDSVCDDWNSLARETILQIRKNAKNNWILVGGTYYNSIFTVKNIFCPEEIEDDHIAYSFHFYEPHIFTHQAAEWEKNMTPDFRVPYPLSVKEYLEVSFRELNGAYSDVLLASDASLSGYDMLAAWFTEAVSVAETRNVPLYCGEYGVIDHANPDYALAWYRDIHSVFEKYNIGRAMWNYRGMGFGLREEEVPFL